MFLNNMCDTLDCAPGCVDISLRVYLCGVKDCKCVCTCLQSLQCAIVYMCALVNQNVMNVGTYF